MLRSLFVSLVVASFFVGFASAADKTNNKTDNKNGADKKTEEAKIVKVDAKNGTVIVKMTHDGKTVEKTFKLAENIEYLDSTGKVAAVDIFTSGDLALIVEEEGKISQMKKNDKSSSTKPTK